MKSRYVIAWLLLSMAMLSASVACAEAAVTPTSENPFPDYGENGRFDRLFSSYEGEKYRAEFGPVPAELVDMSVLTPLDSPVMTYVRPREVQVPEAFAIQGFEDLSFIAGRVSPGRTDISSEAPTPSCEGWSMVSILTAVDVGIKPPPYSYPSPAPFGGEPTPTPVPTSTPLTDPPIELTGEDLLAAGWPNVFWEGHLISYQGRVYAHTIDRYLDFPAPATTISSADLDEIEMIEFDSAPEPEFPEGLEKMFAPATIKNYLRVYEPKDAIDTDVIVIDPCPSDTARAEFLVYRKIVPDD